ncbi:hypothetical protein PUN28_004150 [Cardiocondyla obscurior]|uniref:Secreted protein n=1 Tax=Cardiocondyla obscurior TaxID=286306 RepID=A0AAW2GPT0_9HYME
MLLLLLLLLFVADNGPPFKPRKTNFKYAGYYSAIEGPSRHPVDILRGGGGPGRVSCLGGATHGSRETPLRRIAQCRTPIRNYTNCSRFQCAEGWLVTSHLSGGAGPGASCIGGATYSHRQKSTTPLRLMQIGKSHDFFSRSLESGLLNRQL